MKWKTKEIKYKLVPIFGDKRTIEKFAWYPIKLDNNMTIWFEKYSVIQRYYHNNVNIFDFSNWHNISKFQLNNEVKNK